MAERRTVVDGRTVEYSGLISVRGLYQLVRERLEDLDYDPYDDFHSEQVFEDGKQILITLKGSKKLSDYARVEWKTKFTFMNCVEMTIEKKDRKIKMHKGSVSVKTIVYMTTDYDRSFEQNPFQYFLRVVIDKFVFKSYFSKATKEAKKTYDKLEEDIRTFLNFERF